MRVAAIVSVLVLVATTLARADAPTTEQRAKARELGEAALRKLDDNNDFAGASDLFQKAYDTSHELPYLINVAVTQRKANLPQQAIAAYRRCLAEGGDQLTPDMRGALEADIASVTRESGLVNVRTDGAPAEVLLDDRVAGTASAETPLLVVIAPEAGRIHKLVARRSGFRDAVQSIEQLSIGTPVELTLAPTPIPTKGALTIESVPSGAALRDFGRAPVTVTVDPGDHTIWATLPGYDPAIQTVHVEAGESRKVTIGLRRQPSTWWDRNKWKVIISASVVVVAAGAFGARQAFEPHYGQAIHYP